MDYSTEVVDRIIESQIDRMKRAFMLFSCRQEHFAEELRHIAQEGGAILRDYRHSKRRLTILTAALKELTERANMTDVNDLITMDNEKVKLENEKIEHQNEVRKMERRLFELENDVRLMEEEDRWNYIKFLRDRCDFARHHLTPNVEDENEELDDDTIIYDLHAHLARYGSFRGDYFRELDDDTIIYDLHAHLARYGSIRDDLVATMQAMRMAGDIRNGYYTTIRCVMEALEMFEFNRRNFSEDLKRIAKEATDIRMCYPNINGRLGRLEELDEQARMAVQNSVSAANIKEMEDEKIKLEKLLVDDIQGMKQRLVPLEDGVRTLVKQDRFKFNKYAQLRMILLQDDIRGDASLYGICGRLTRAAERGEDHEEFEFIYDDIIAQLDEQVARIRTENNNKIDELERDIWI